MITASSIFFTAANAARAQLPPESLALIVQHDALHFEWICQKPLPAYPAPLKALAEAIKADPLADAMMQVRILGNEASYKENTGRGSSPEQAHGLSASSLQ